MIISPENSDRILSIFGVCMTREQLLQGQSASVQFDRLLRDLINGTLTRSDFEQWEIELLLDISECHLPVRRRWEILGDYQSAVGRDLRNGTTMPMKLSEYLAAKRRKPDLQENNSLDFVD
jgi:hypothetical protein